MIYSVEDTKSSTLFPLYVYIYSAVLSYDNFYLHNQYFLSIFVVTDLTIHHLEIKKIRRDKAMARIHYLNVGSGDCIILQTNSGRVSVIDICSGNLVKTATQSYLETLAELSQKPRGNFGMCSKPTNPLDYLKEIGINSIHRFVLSHPDMDHMD